MNYRHETWREAAKAWEKGDIVATASLGGISPGYEQAIQILLFELMLQWDGEFLKKDATEAERKEFYSGPWDKHVNEVVSKLDDEVGGFSGAQVGAAKSTAFQFMYYGYTEMLDKLDDDRHMQVSKWFPRSKIN